MSSPPFGGRRDATFRPNRTLTHRFQDWYYFVARGEALRRLGRHKEAFANLLEAHKRDRENVKIINVLWSAAARVKKFSYCLHFSQLLIKSKPESIHVKRVYALSLAQCDRANDALPLIETVIKQQPTSFDFDLRGQIHFLLGNTEKAFEDYKRSYNMDPRRVDLLVRYAFFLATCPNSRFRDGRKAQSLAEECLKRLEPSEQRSIARMVLAMSHAEQGEFDNAVNEVKKAIEENKLDAKDEERWKLLSKEFQAGRAYRYDVKKPESILFQIPPLMDFGMYEKKWWEVTTDESSDKK